MSRFPTLERAGWKCLRSEVECLHVDKHGDVKRVEG